MQIFISCGILHQQWILQQNVSSCSCFCLFFWGGGSAGSFLSLFLPAWCHSLLLYLFIFHTSLPSASPCVFVHLGLTYIYLMNKDPDWVPRGSIYVWNQLKKIIHPKSENILYHLVCEDWTSFNNKRHIRQLLVIEQRSDVIHKRRRHGTQGRSGHTCSRQRCRVLVVRRHLSRFFSRSEIMEKQPEPIRAGRRGNGLRIAGKEHDFEQRYKKRGCCPTVT